MAQQRKLRTQVPTPAPLAAELVQLAPSHWAASATIIDPACGDGNLLLAWVERCLATSDDALTRATLAENLHGSDTDPACVARCRERLAQRLCLATEALGDRILTADATSRPWGRTFDLVLMNPPWAAVDLLPRSERVRLAARFPAVHEDKADLQHYFLALAIELAGSDRESGAPGGHVLAIISRTLLEAAKARRLRAHLATAAELLRVRDFGRERVFEGAEVGTAILHLRAGRTADEAPFLVSHGEHTVTRSREGLATGDWSLHAPRTGPIAALIAHVDAMGSPLKEVLTLHQGMQTGHNDAFVITDPAELEGAPAGTVFFRVRNSDITPFVLRERDERLLLTNRVASIEALPKPTRARLGTYQAELSARAACQRGNCAWWQFTWPLGVAHIDRPRLFVPYLGARLRAGLDPTARFLGLTDTTVLYDRGQPEDLRYVLALLNSRLLDFRHRHHAKLRGNVYELYATSLAPLPIRRIDFSDPRDCALHADIVRLVDARITAEAAQQAALEAALDSRVEALYGLDLAMRGLLDRP